MDDTQLRTMVKKYDAEQREDEVVWFYRHAESISPKVVVEIGIKEGGNLKVLSTLLPEDGLAIGIDPRKEIPWRMDDSDCEVVHIIGRSGSFPTLQKLKDVLNGRKIDVLFIDGDHSYGGMISDFNLYSPFVRDGGIIAVHDIYYLKDVTEAWATIPGEKFESSYNQSSLGIGFVFKQ